jgi:hypothetical protein
MDIPCGTSSLHSSRLVVALALSFLFSARSAFAQETASCFLEVANSSLTSIPDLLNHATDGRVIGGSGGGVFQAGTGPRGGLLFELDLGGGMQLPFGAPLLAGLSLGAEIGYETIYGLAFGLRYDDQYLNPGGGENANFQFVTFAVRYTFPYPIPMPFVEAAAGLSIASLGGPLGSEGGGTDFGPGGALGVGIAIPLSHHAAIDVGFRDWIAPANGSVFQVLSLQVGINFTTGGAAGPH